MDVESILVEYTSPTDNEIYTNSGLLFSNEYVLITSNVLMPYLKTITSDLAYFLRNLQSDTLYFGNNFLPVKSQPDLRTVQKSTQNARLKCQNAHIVAGFVSQNILTSCQKYLSDWAIDFQNKIYQAKEFLSLFFILRIGSSELDLDHLKCALAELVDRSRKFHLTIGCDVFSESTPFGNRTFLNSYSQGVISNIVGEGSCFILSDCASAPGSEGASMFIKVKNDPGRFPIGIIISCLNWWKGEWIGFTLAANLQTLFNALIPKNTRKENICSINRLGNDNHKELLATSSKCLVQVVSGSSWGTAVCLNKNKGLFLTNSHVIESSSTSIYWKNKPIRMKILYKTPNAEPYDLAVIQCDPLKIRDLSIDQIQFALRPPKIGEEVFAAGFPLFPKELQPVVTLTRGHVSQVDSSMLKTSCRVLPGSSGGAILTPDGYILGVIVSNTRLDNLGVVYPHVNMAIPFLAVRSVIENFLLTDDIAVLQQLHCQQHFIIKQWGPISKL